MDDLPLSPRALGWLRGCGVVRSRRPLSEAATRALLRRRSRPEWDAIVAVETTFGGLKSDVHGRMICCGSVFGKGFGETRQMDGREYALVGMYDPILWWMDEGGGVVEVDDLGERFFESDSLRQRIEQLAVFPGGGPAKGFEGRQGEGFARSLGLAAMLEVDDSRQRYWGTNGSEYEPASGVLVWERYAPSDYGRADRVWMTWIAAPRASELDAAVKQVIDQGHGPA